MTGWREGGRQVTQARGTRKRGLTACEPSGHTHTRTAICQHPINLITPCLSVLQKQNSTCLMSVSNVSLSPQEPQALPIRQSLHGFPLCSLVPSVIRSFPWFWLLLLFLPKALMSTVSAVVVTARSISPLRLSAMLTSRSVSTTPASPYLPPVSMLVAHMITRTMLYVWSHVSRGIGQPE